MFKPWALPKIGRVKSIYTNKIMGVSQFTKYTSSDASGPGTMSGTVGSVLTVLDACLVNGYSGKTAAGWTKPFANSGNIGCYKQGSGSGFSLVINDNGTGTAGAQEFFATGWQTLAGIGSPVGSGTGQFPTPAQLLTNGEVVARKSAAASGVGRGWVVFADSSTFYLFIASGDLTGCYMDFGFGNCYALEGLSSDPYCCIIMGRNTQNEANTAPATNFTQFGGVDCCSFPGVGSSIVTKGHYVANNAAGSSGSMTVYKFGDVGKGAAFFTGSVTNISGTVPAPNPYDGAYYMSPLFIMDTSFGIRGYLRGLYQLCHPTTSFTDGQTFNGANDFAGKSFQLVVQGQGGGMYCVETSNTVPTN
jgi:hypothetical protein